MPHLRLAVVATSTALLLCSPRLVLAQTSSSPVVPAQMPGVSKLFSPLAGDFRQMSNGGNLLLAGLGASSALASHSVDTRIARSLWTQQPAVREAMEGGKVVGDFLTQLGSALAVYTVGRATGQSRLATVGAEIFRAQVVAQGTTQFVKVTTRRTRPDGTTMSLPSGHTAATFATATVLQREFGWKAGVPAYALATWVAASRMQTKRHYLSDVIAGATVGIMAGRSVTVGRGAAKFELTPNLVPGGLGVNFVAVGR